MEQIQCSKRILCFTKIHNFKDNCDILKEMNKCHFWYITYLYVNFILFCIYNLLKGEMLRFLKQSKKWIIQNTLDWEIYKNFLCWFQERHQGSSYPQPMAAKVPLVVLLGLWFLSRGLPLLCMLSRSSERLVTKSRGKNWIIMQHKKPDVELFFVWC